MPITIIAQPSTWPIPAVFGLSILLTTASAVPEHGTFGYIDTFLATPKMNAFLRE